MDQVFLFFDNFNVTTNKKDMEEFRIVNELVSSIKKQDFKKI